MQRRPVVVEIENTFRSDNDTQVMEFSWDFYSACIADENRALCHLRLLQEN